MVTNIDLAPSPFQYDTEFDFSTKILRRNQTEDSLGFKKF
jgi:hypothetical protein